MRRELLSKLGDRSAAAVMRRELQDEVIRPMLNRAPRCGTYLLGRIRCAYAQAAEQGRVPDDFVFPSPRDGHHVAQKTLGLAQYEARKEKEGQPRGDYLDALTVRNVVPLRAACLTAVAAEAPSPVGASVMS